MILPVPGLLREKMSLLDGGLNNSPCSSWERKSFIGWRIEWFSLFLASWERKCLLSARHPIKEILYLHREGVLKASAVPGRKRNNCSLEFPCSLHDNFYCSFPQKEKGLGCRVWGGGGGGGCRVPAVFGTKCRVPEFIDSVRNFKKPLFFCSWPFREGTNKGGGTASERPKV